MAAAHLQTYLPLAGVKAFPAAAAVKGLLMEPADMAGLAGAAAAVTVLARPVMAAHLAGAAVVKVLAAVLMGFL